MKLCNQATLLFDQGFTAAQIARALKISLFDAYVLVGDIGDDLAAWGDEFTDLEIDADLEDGCDRENVAQWLTRGSDFIAPQFVTPRLLGCRTMTFVCG